MNKVTFVMINAIFYSILDENALRMWFFGTHLKHVYIVKQFSSKRQYYI